MLAWPTTARTVTRSEEHTSELQSRPHLVCRLLLEKKKNKHISFFPLKKKKKKQIKTKKIKYYINFNILFHFFFFYCFYVLNLLSLFFFFFNDTATTEIYTLSLHDALPI